MAKRYKCQFCDFIVFINRKKKLGIKSAKNLMGQHYDEKHKDMIPPDVDGYRFFYYLLTKKENGSCVICHKETEFNRNSMKYSRFCKDPNCKDAYVKQAKGRMLGKYGKIHLLNSPTTQLKMQQGRKIAGKYRFADGIEFGYLGSYEKDFLRFLDQELKWPSQDIFAPSPHTYEYEYKGVKHFYMPDFFITSLNLEVEIKDDGSAKQINEDSRAKDVIKEDLMRSMNKMFNYIKIINRNYEEFKQLVSSGEEPKT